MTEPNCSFCDIRQFEERLIAEVDGFYVIATLGQITDGGYVLLFPVEHTPCMGALPNEKAEVSDRLIAKIAFAIVAEYRTKLPFGSLMPITLFEHGIVGQTVKHAHLHFIPTVLDLTPRIRVDFPDSVVKELQWAGQLEVSYRNNPRPYLYWVTGKAEDVAERVCWNTPAPLQYLRVIVAEALGRPERANWRTMDPELDKRLWSETVRLLRPYF